MSAGFIYVLAELIVVVSGGVFHRFAVSVQFSRAEQLVVLWMIPVIPYYLAGVLRTPSSFPRLNRVLVISGAVFAFVITVIAFVAPDLFRSVSTMHHLAQSVESTYGRGEGGVLTTARNVAFLVIVIYGTTLVVLEVVNYLWGRANR